jgi:inorganic pyrophosphatase
VSKLTRMYDGIKDIEDFPEIQLERVKHFFTHYKDLEPGKWAKIDRIGNLADAKKVILDSIAMANSGK